MFNRIHSNNNYLIHVIYFVLCLAVEPMTTLSTLQTGLLYIYIIFIRTYFLQSSTQKMQLYTNRIYKKIIILLIYMNKMNSDMGEN